MSLINPIVYTPRHYGIRPLIVKIVLVNKIREGFSDFYAIEFNNLFPRSLIIDEILPSLNAIQKDSIRDQQFYKNCPEFKKLIKMSQRMMSVCSMNMIEEEYENLQDLSKKKNILGYFLGLIFYLIL